LKNYYTILEVPVGGEIAEIREAYRRLAQKNMFDKQAFADLVEAYEVLSSPARRREYDKRIIGDGSRPPQQTPMEIPSLNNPDEMLIAGPARKCPMGKESECPVVNGTVPADETFCPECGFQLSDLPEAGFELQPSLVDMALEFRLEEETGRVHRLVAGVNTVGRESGHVILPDRTVSRDHADIHVRPEGTVFIEDKGSTNGTQINGERLAAHFPREVLDGDTIRFGSIRMLLRMPGGTGGVIDGADKQVLTDSGMALVPGVITEMAPPAERESGSVSDMSLVPGASLGFEFTMTGEPVDMEDDPKNHSGMFVVGPAGVLAEASEDEDSGGAPSPASNEAAAVPGADESGANARPEPPAAEFATVSRSSLPSLGDLGSDNDGLGLDGIGDDSEDEAELPTMDPPKARLVAVGDTAFETYVMRSETVSFGRRAENSIVIRDDPYVSGRHAEITCQDGAFILTDLGSTNGTLLNGQRIAANTPMTLANGMQIAVGGRVMRFEIEGSEQSTSDMTVDPGVNADRPADTAG
jgi:pSer/pThr/pTyr-binding forkhead associated (FHA) protein